jgi:hypothetical protein
MIYFFLFGQPYKKTNSLAAFYIYRDVLRREKLFLISKQGIFRWKDLLSSFESAVETIKTTVL